MFQYFSRRHGTSGRLIRLSYAIDMRYGVLHDLARKIHSGAAVDLTMGHVNIIWQGDANSRALRALAHCTTPASGLNVSGPIRRVRELAEALGERLGRAPAFTGREAADAWVLNCAEAERLFGPPEVPWSACSTGPPTGSPAACPAWARTRTSTRAMGNTEVLRSAYSGRKTSRAGWHW